MSRSALTTCGDIAVVGKRKANRLDPLAFALLPIATSQDGFDDYYPGIISTGVDTTRQLPARFFESQPTMRFETLLGAVHRLAAIKRISAMPTGRDRLRTDVDEPID